MDATAKHLLEAIATAQGQWRIVDGQMLPEITTLVRAGYVTSRRCDQRRHPVRYGETIWNKYQDRPTERKYAVYLTDDGRQYFNTQIDNQPTLF